MDLDEVLEPFVKNFKRIFYSQTEQGEERLSTLKLALVGAYLLANLFAFLQFSRLSDPIVQLNSEVQDDVNISSVNYQIQLTIYGTLAHYLNFLVLIGALAFVVTQDKPLSLRTKQIREFTSQSRLHFIGLIGGVVAGTLLT